MNVKEFNIITGVVIKKRLTLNRVVFIFFYLHRMTSLFIVHLKLKQYLMNKIIYIKYFLIDL